MTAIGQREHQELPYWRRVQGLAAVLLLIRFLVSFGAIYWARNLNFVLLGWLLRFWMAALGSLIANVQIMAGYSWAMNRLDHRTGVQELEA